MDFAARESFEAALTRALGKVHREQLAELMAALGDPPRWENLPPDFFTRFEGAVQAALQNALESAYLAMSEQMTAEIGFAFTGANTRATAWAKTYSYALVSRIGQTTRLELQKAFSDYFQQAMTQGQLREQINVSALRDKLGRWLMPETRAEMIAQTEVTRAAAEAQAGFVAELKQANPALVMDEYWITANDEIVRQCPICWPRHNTKRGDGWTESPPAHPRCRCSTRFVLRMPNKRQAVTV